MKLKYPWAVYYKKNKSDRWHRVGSYSTKSYALNIAKGFREQNKDYKTKVEKIPEY